MTLHILWDLSEVLASYIGDKHLDTTTLLPLNILQIEKYLGGPSNLLQCPIIGIIFMHTCTVTKSRTINLQELCLERLSSWLKTSDQVDRLPLPTRLKRRLYWCLD